jgi:hypothetical protein
MKIPHSAALFDLPLAFATQPFASDPLNSHSISDINELFKGGCGKR